MKSFFLEDGDFEGTPGSVCDGIFIMRNPLVKYFCKSL